MSPKSRNSSRTRAIIGGKRPELSKRKPDHEVKDRTFRSFVQEEKLLRSMRLLQGALTKDKRPWPYR